MPKLPSIEAPGVEEITTALIGRPDGKRQRLFRKAKETAVKLYIRALPEVLDKTYTSNLIKAAWAEFLAVLIFVFVGAGTVISSAIQSQSVTGDYTLDSGRMLVIALGHGIALGLTVAGSAGISGGHVNPAVSLAFVVTGRLDALAGGVYIIAQLLASYVAALLLAYIWNSTSLVALAATVPSTYVDSSLRATLIEAILTYVLVFAIWATAVDPRGNKVLAPYFIGLSVFLGILVGIPLTGPSMNPARTFGIALFSSTYTSFWSYIVGPLLGAALASLIYDYTFIRTTPEEENVEVYEEIVVE